MFRPVELLYPRAPTFLHVAIGQQACSGCGAQGRPDSDSAGTDAALGAGFLNGRTGNCAVGAENAAVPLLRFQDRAATLTIVIVQAGARGHGFCFAMSAVRTGERRFQLSIGHVPFAFITPYTVMPTKSASAGRST